MQGAGLGAGNDERGRTRGCGAFELTVRVAPKRGRRQLHSVPRRRVRPFMKPSAEHPDPQFPEAVSMTR